MSKNSSVALITGIAGFCGSYLAELLAAEGRRVVGLDASGEGVQRLRGLGLDVVVHQADLTDALGLRALIAEVQPDQVYHLAALTNPAAPYRRLYEVNVYGTIHLLEALAAAAPAAALLL
ncbi:MAG TPA: GDP-mannose 4,6-dehydratase, partial [Anaerolineae bacterium]|nr:GDP-mannose 4,6-dehydratase [Anaerolineae bacterium]